MDLTKMGCLLLFIPVLQPCLQEYFNIIHNQELMEDSDIFKMKEALWAVVCMPYYFHIY